MSAARVLFLLTQSLDYPSGLGRYWPVARQMARLGYAVEIAALHPTWTTLPEKRFIRDGVTVSYVSQMHVRQVGNRREYFSPPQLLWRAALATLALARIALARRVDVIHIAKAQPLNGLAGWLGMRLRGPRLYLDADDYEAASNTFSAGWQKAVVAWWEDRLPLIARGITVNTTFLRERCVHLGAPAGRVRVIPNGFDPDRFRPVSDIEREAVRRRWGLENHKVVLYLGSLSLSSHPILLLLDAFTQVQRQMESARLLLVGGGEDYDRVAQAIHERDLSQAVVMAGSVEAAHVPAIYAASEVVVDPVADDDVARARSPLKVVESLACGVPVVTGNVGDRALMLEDGRAGVLVTPGDAARLAEGILGVLTDQAYWEQLSMQARAAAEQFRWDKLVHEFTRVYEF